MSYGELISIRVWGQGVEKECAIERSAATAPGDPLDRFAGYSWTHAEWGTRHTEIAAQLDDEGAGAESVIIISELLAEDQYDDEHYVILREQDNRVGGAGDGLAPLRMGNQRRDGGLAGAPSRS